MPVYIVQLILSILLASENIYILSAMSSTLLYCMLFVDWVNTYHGHLERLPETDIYKNTSMSWNSTGTLNNREKWWPGLALGVYLVKSAIEVYAATCVHEGLPEQIAKQVVILTSG
jgi:hypothetical protein